MNARKSILATLRQHQQTSNTPLPSIVSDPSDPEVLLDTFTESVAGVGGRVVRVHTIDAVEPAIHEYIVQSGRIVTTISALEKTGELITGEVSEPRTYADVTLSVIPAHFAVAENGAVWLTEEAMGHRVLPFICQHL